MRTCIRVFVSCLILMLSSVSLWGQSIFSLSGDSVVVNNEYIKPLVGNSVFSMHQGSVSIADNNSSINYSVAMSRFCGWENDPGDFHVITVYKSTNLLFRLQNSDAWIKVPSSLRRYSDNDYFIPVKLSDSATALFFIGYTYASQPPYLTIIVLKGEKAKLVFNQNYIIQQVNKTDSAFSMILRAKFGEWSNDADAANAKDVYSGAQYKIWLENGVLKFQKL